MSGGRRILKNVGALVLARGVTATLTLATTVYLGRTLGPDAYGILSWALAFYTFFAVVPNLGLNVYGAREGARDAGRIGPLVSHILPLRLTLAVATYATYLAIVWALDESPTFKAVVAVQGLALFGHALSVEWVYESVQRMGKLASRNVIMAVATFGGTLYLVREPDDVVLAAVMSVVALAGANAWLVLTYHREFGPLRARFDRDAWVGLIRGGYPIALSIFMFFVYTNMDQVMLGFLRTEEEVGWYGAAYRLIAAAIIPAQIALQAFMPALSAAFGDADAMREQARHFATALFAVGLPLMGVGVFLAPDLISIFGAAYAPAAPVLAVLMVNVGMTYAHFVYGRALVAWDEERPYMRILIAGAALNVVLNFALIPPFGIIGAAAATLLSEGVVAVGAAVLFRRMTGTVYGAAFARVALATALGVGLPIALRLGLGWSPLAVLPLAAAGYAAAVVATGAADLGALVALVRSRRT